MEQKLDIVIPVYNEAENIHAVLDTFHASVKTEFRVLICYDSDEDTTLGALKTYPQAAQMNILPVKNTGVGVLGAVKSGFAASDTPAILVYPADDTFNAQAIDKMYAKFEEGCDIVAASRFVPGGCMENAPWVKAVLVRMAAFSLYHLAKLPTHDPTNGLRLFSRRVIDTITIESTKGWTFSLELLVKCHRRGWKVGEVPALWIERTKGKSRFKIFDWLPLYLRWFFYAFGTTYLGKKAI